MEEGPTAGVAVGEVAYLTPEVRDALGVHAFETRTVGSALGLALGDGRLRMPDAAGGEDGAEWVEFEDAETVALVHLDAAVDALPGPDGRGVRANDLAATVDDAVDAVEDGLGAEFEGAVMLTDGTAHGDGPRLTGGPADAADALRRRGVATATNTTSTGAPGMALGVRGDGKVYAPNYPRKRRSSRPQAERYARDGPLLVDRTEAMLDDAGVAGVETVGAVVREGRSAPPETGAVGVGAGEVGYLVDGVERVETVADPVAVAVEGPAGGAVFRPPLDDDRGLVGRIAGRGGERVRAAVEAVAEGLDGGFDRATVVAADDAADERGLTAVHDALTAAGLGVDVETGGERWVGVDREGVYRASAGAPQMGGPGLDRFPSDRMASVDGAAAPADLLDRRESFEAPSHGRD
jgi:hypothetical protein